MHTSHDQLEFKMMGSDNALVEAIEAGRTTQPTVAPVLANTQPAANDPLSLLKKLAELKELGVLSESEFQEKKQALLAKV